MPKTNEEDQVNTPELEDDDEFNWGEDLGFDDEEFEPGYKIDPDDPRYDALVEKARKEAEQAVVEALSSGDTNNEIYKGLQRVLSKKDREILEYRQALSALEQEARNLREGSSYNNMDVNFLASTLLDMLDDEGREVFNKRLMEHTSKKQNVAVSNYLRAQQAGTGNSPANAALENWDPNGDDEFKQYVGMAVNHMRQLAEAVGIDPSDSNLDYGNDDEPIVARLDKLNKSIAKIRSGDITNKGNSVRRKSGAGTRTDPTPNRAYGENLIERGMQDWLKRVRNL